MRPSSQRDTFVKHANLDLIKRENETDGELGKPKIKRRSGEGKSKSEKTRWNIKSKNKRNYARLTAQARKSIASEGRGGSSSSSGSGSSSISSPSDSDSVSYSEELFPVPPPCFSSPWSLTMKPKTQHLLVRGGVHIYIRNDGLEGRQRQLLLFGWRLKESYSSSVQCHATGSKGQRQSSRDRLDRRSTTVSVFTKPAFAALNVCEHVYTHTLSLFQTPFSLIRQWHYAIYTTVSVHFSHQEYPNEGTERDNEKVAKKKSH